MGLLHASPLLANPHSIVFALPPFAVIISVCWVAGAIVGFLPLFGWHAAESEHQECFFVEVMDYNYLVFLYFATIITPALLMLAFYTHIYRVIIKQVRISLQAPRERHS